jgi:branched-chain amino acid transport system permease protein
MPFSEPVQALVAINLLLTLSLLFPFAAGVWSLGMSGFMASGAYTAGYTTTVLGWDVAPALALGAGAGLLSTVPVGLLATRVRGIYLSIATLAEAELIILFFSHFEPTGDVMGMTGMPYVGAGPIVMTAVAALAVAAWLFAAPVGKALIAAGSDPVIASCNAVNVPAMRAVSLAIGGLLAGLAGGFYAHFYSFISPTNFAATRVVDNLMFLVVGGLTPLGAAVGAIGLTLLPQVSRGLELWAPAIYGVVVILTMAIAPDGLLPKNRLTTLWRRVMPVRVKAQQPERTHA